jgi:hypothetical protein
MNSTILTLILLPILTLVIYLLARKFTKGNDYSPDLVDLSELKEEHSNEFTVEVRETPRIIIKETVREHKKEIVPNKRKYSKKKTSSSSSIGIDELPKAKKSSPKKSYYKKKKDTKKDKGDDLLLS